ncbi:MAG TPA: peptidase M1 [Cytophagales bacterium]|nr:peptidase M1 [Cytophagales bacterium]HAA24257.1 peptidase M1 [Cytophagales bacterium]HAP60237.1 peptidase M1 [Cytophagales bacterium]
MESNKTSVFAKKRTLHWSYGLVLAFVLGGFEANAQHGYWQQHVAYTMDIDFDTENHQFKGEQEIVYTNNSPDTLRKVFYHLYYNAFQPGSMMDIRSRTIDDPDGRVRDRIFHLEEDEIGYHRVSELKQDGANLSYEVTGTILEVELAKALLPGKSTTLSMKFDSQVPIQIRRTGRDNKEGISYSMTQWYPKLAEYDKHGWHADPYVGREFHGVWGSFDVTIHLDSAYLIGGTGYLQNAQEIGHGYENESKPVRRKRGRKLSWHFQVDKVHDFAWAADPDYAHEIVKEEGIPDLHFIYQNDDREVAANWDKLKEYAVQTFQIMNEKYGKYPYDDYTIIQGGDGGMEYPMATLITSGRNLRGLVSVTVHESIHSWYQGVLAFNESKYPWMDEGFTTYCQYMIMDSLFNENRINPLARAYGAYQSLVEADMQEPMTTHGDHYDKNRTYSISTYLKGAIYLHQLSYIIGQKAFDQGMLDLWNQWAFKHPDPTDFKRVMEKRSGLELDWYNEQWIGSTNAIDYGIKSMELNDDSSIIILEKIGLHPMPLDVVVTMEGGEQKLFYIPLEIMRGHKPEEKGMPNRVIMEDWPWPYPYYELKVEGKVESVEIDPSLRMADVDRFNNVFPIPSSIRFFGKENGDGN